MKIVFPVIAVIVLLTTSCKTSNKLTALKYLKDSTSNAQLISNLKSGFEPVIIPGDRLDVLVTALDPQSAQAYNINALLAESYYSNFNNARNNVNTGGYLVDTLGYISMPQVGRIFVKGKTRSELATTVKDSVSKYLLQPYVTVNFLNFRVNIIGEVNKPGTYNVSDGNLNILEALSIAGDLTVFGDRKEIMLIREFDNKRSIEYLDLSSKKIFESNSFMLRQNDIIYVQPTKSKAVAGDIDFNRKLSLASIVIGLVTAVGILIR